MRDQIRFKMEDAPALAATLNPDARIEITDLVYLIRESQGTADRLEPMVVCGNDLLRSPVVQIDFGGDRGSVIVSQLLTEGRLAEGFGESGLYGRRYDEAAVQFVLNMLSSLKSPDE